MQINFSVSDDASLLSRLHAQGFAGSGKGWNEKDFLDFLSDDSFIALLASLKAGSSLKNSAAEKSSKATAAGFVLLRDMRKEAEIITLAVITALRRRGIAGALLLHAEAEMKRRGICRLWLEVAASNVAALSLYKKLGYEKCGLRTNYYHGTDGKREDAILMSKHV